METFHDRRPLRDACGRLSERCYVLFPCLSDPGRRSSLCLKVALLFLHVVIVGYLFAVDGVLIRDIRKKPWHTAMYLVLFVLTLVQYFFTSLSSPGYVLDAMKTGNGAYSSFQTSSRISFKDKLLLEKLEAQFLLLSPLIWEAILLE